MLFVTAALGMGLSHAECGFASYFRDNMVIQRDQTIEVWGHGAVAGSSIIVAVTDKSGNVLSRGETQATGDSWSVVMDRSIPASSAYHELTLAHGGVLSARRSRCLSRQWRLDG